MADRRAGGGQAWYIAEDKNGFTADPDKALKDYLDRPVLCPGDVNRVWKAEYARFKAQRDRVWTMLLDSMERMYDAEERSTPEARLDRLMMDLEEQQKALIDVLCVLELPAGKFDSDPEGCRSTIKRMADNKYEQES